MILIRRFDARSDGFQDAVAEKIAQTRQNYENHGFQPKIKANQGNNMKKLIANIASALLMVYFARAVVLVAVYITHDTTLLASGWFWGEYVLPGILSWVLAYFVASIDPSAKKWVATVNRLFVLIARIGLAFSGAFTGFLAFLALSWHPTSIVTYLLILGAIVQIALAYLLSAGGWKRMAMAFKK